MNRPACRSGGAGVTVLELLCVVAIIAVLAGLLLGPVSRALHRARAMKWGQEAPALLDQTVSQLQSHFRGQTDFPPVTLAQLEQRGILGPTPLQFLKDRRVTFVSFAGGDPKDKVVIRVLVESGFLTDPGYLAATKGDITDPPE